MSKLKVLVLGATGMLGSACFQILKSNEKLYVVGTSRNQDKSFLNFDVKVDDIAKLIDATRPDYLINCIGVIKPHINENDSLSIENAINVNSIFPHRLSIAAAEFECKIIQIATDCVFSGKTGKYDENSPHDALDVYGKTKSLGEVSSPLFCNLRVSIIGPEKNRSTSLFEWFRNQPQNAQLCGYSNHFWNGVTTFTFAKIVNGIITNKTFNPGTFHIEPADQISKFELLGIFRKTLHRSDIAIESTLPDLIIDRTLTTIKPDFNNKAWLNAGYEIKPTIQDIIEEMPTFIY